MCTNYDLLWYDLKAILENHNMQSLWLYWYQMIGLYPQLIKGIVGEIYLQ